MPLKNCTNSSESTKGRHQQPRDAQKQKVYANESQPKDYAARDRAEPQIKRKKAVWAHELYIVLQ